MSHREKKRRGAHHANSHFVRKGKTKRQGKTRQGKEKIRRERIDKVLMMVAAAVT